MNFLRNFLIAFVLCMGSAGLSSMEVSKGQKSSLPSLTRLAAEQVLKNARERESIEETRQDMERLPEEVRFYVRACHEARPQRRSFLHEATSIREVMQLVEGIGVNPVSKTRTDETPLMTLLRSGKRDEAYALLNFMNANKLPCDQKDMHGQTALSIAKRFEDEEMIALLKNERPNVKPIKQETIAEDPTNKIVRKKLKKLLSFQSYAKAEEFLRKLPESVSLSSIALEAQKQDKYTGLTALHTVNHPEQVKILMQLGVDFNISSNEGQKPLHVYIKTGNFDVALELLKIHDESLCIDVRDHLGCTPISYAIIGKHNELIAMLIARKANTRSKIKAWGNSTSPLELFLDRRFYNAELVPLLFSQDVLAELSIPTKMRLLQRAVCCDFDPVKEILLGDETFETLTDSNGMNFIMYLVQNNHNETLKKVLKTFKDPATLKAVLERTDHRSQTALFYAIFKGSRTLKTLLEHNVNINHQNNRGHTVLYFAQEYKSLLKQLLKKNPNVNLASVFGSTPLHEAVKKEHSECAELLLQYGADVNAQSNNGVTPLHVAAIKQPVLVDTLLNYYPLIDICAQSGRTPFMTTLVCNNVESAKTIIGSRSESSCN